MYRKWKSVAALGMAVLIGCSMPMGTMLAAEENPEAVQEVEVDSASDTDAAYDDETVLDDNGNGGDEADVDDEIADEEVVADNDETAGIMVMSAADAEAGDVEVQASSAAPVIDITLNGESCKVDGLGGDIEYKYTSSSDSKLGFSASQNGTSIMFCYYLDENPGDKAKDDIPWSGECSSMQWTLSDNKSYVVYVKAGEDENTAYARSCGIVVDTEAPQVTGVTNGGTYPEGTAFTVSDANLDVVTVNETPVNPESGSYRVIANGTSCVIKAKDKAGNTTTCSITVTARDLEENGVISVSGTYFLKPGVSYQLAAGKWQVGGDKSVYTGGNTFYVNADGNYSFTKR